MQLIGLVWYHRDPGTFLTPPLRKKPSLSCALLNPFAQQGVWPKETKRNQDGLSGGEGEPEFNQQEIVWRNPQGPLYPQNTLHSEN